ncbi:MAG: hypothetical protein BWX88_02328 [Planctomycetes bacterium ADurb.Bin126]|nr:MAG: hypothetical protein BWX88_02328 [Planctomycetes bacterium ADurb.Bin126]
MGNYHRSPTAQDTTPRSSSTKPKRSPLPAIELHRLAAGLAVQTQKLPHALAAGDERADGRYVGIDDRIGKLYNLLGPDVFGGHIPERSTESIHPYARYASPTQCLRFGKALFTLGFTDVPLRNQPMLSGYLGGRRRKAVFGKGLC